MRIQTSNDLCTPDCILDLVRQLGPIALDPCSNPWSTVGARIELDGSPGKCGLEASWLELSAGGLVYVNCPYGRGHMPRWSDKTAAEAWRGVEIIALVKGDHSTEWHRKLRESATAMAYMWKRVGFEGGDHGSGNFASTAFYFGPRAHLFCHAFGVAADVRVLR